MLICSRVSRSGGASKQARLQQAVTNYLSKLQALHIKASSSLKELTTTVPLSLKDIAKTQEIQRYQSLLEKHIDLITRRLLKGETIPHHEKIFSIFEPHSEWIAKGKIGTPVELGHRFLITSAQSGIIVDYKVMEKRSDVDEVPDLLDRLSATVGLENIHSMSFDKGFTSAANKTLLEDKQIPNIIMPKKGKLSKTEYQQQHQKSWLHLRHQHSAVESNINSLEHHGLDRCPDKGLAHYKAYAGLGVLAYNLHKIGKALQAKERLKASKRPPKPTIKQAA